MYSTHLKNLIKLVLNIADTGEGRQSRQHLSKDTPNAPHIEGGGVVGGAQQDVWRPIPQCHHLM